MELVDESKLFDLDHPSGCKFMIRHWTIGMQDEVEKKCIVGDGKGGFSYLISAEREAKLDLSVQDWKGVTLNGQEVPCTSENKRKLPVGVIMWLIREIDERAGLRMTEDEKKN